MKLLILKLKLFYGKEKRVLNTRRRLCLTKLCEGPLKKWAQSLTKTPTTFS